MVIKSVFGHGFDSHHLHKKNILYFGIFSVYLYIYKYKNISSLKSYRGVVAVVAR